MEKDCQRDQPLHLRPLGANCRQEVKTARRILTVLLAAVFVGLVWRGVGGSTWEQGVDALIAGEQFTTFTEPLRLIAGALFVAVPAVLLIRAAWVWLHAPAQPSRGPNRR